MHLGIDLTGGDQPPDLYFDAVMQASRELASSSILHIFATQLYIEQFSLFVQKNEGVLDLIHCHAVTEMIEMSDHPLSAIRRKKNSSIVVGLRMLKKKQLDAFISCGNTGALIAGATLSLPMLPGITRPALMALLPTAQGSVAVLDVGGMMACKPLNLVQFATLGSAYQSAVNGLEVPKIGLLNIGAEATKGTLELRHAYELLKENCIRTGMRFVGNIEGRDIFNGGVDVLVTDGFTGNVMLKTAEGVASFIFEKLERSIEGSDAFKPAFEEIKKFFNYHQYPGALICGVEGLVIKIHGSASSSTLKNSILAAAKAVKKEHIRHIKTQLAP